MAINYIPIEPLPNPAPAVPQTVALPTSPTPQPSAFPADSAPPPAYSEDNPSPMPLDIFWRLRHHRITITCCICLYLLFAYKVYLYFGEAHHGIDTLLAWCILFWACVFLSIIWNVEIPEVDELPMPATSETEQRTKTQMYAASLVLVGYVWLLYWAVGTFQSWMLFLSAEVWLAVSAGSLIELWMAV